MGLFLVPDNCVFNGPLDRSLCSFARTAHSLCFGTLHSQAGSLPHGTVKFMNGTFRGSLDKKIRILFTICHTFCSLFLLIYQIIDLPGIFELTYAIIADTQVWIRLFYLGTWVLQVWTRVLKEKENKAGCSANTSRVRVGRGRKAHFHFFNLMTLDGLTEGRRPHLLCSR